MKWNLWVWSEPSWYVSACYYTEAQATMAGERGSDGPNTWIVCRLGSTKDTYLRAHCTDRAASGVRAWAK